MKVILVLLYVLALSQAYYDREKIERMFDACKEETGAKETFEEVRGGAFPESREGKCLVECQFRKKGIYDATGKYSEEGARKYFLEIFAHKPELVEKLLQIANHCHEVTPIPDSVKDNKCEICALRAKCGFAHYKQEGINIREEAPATRNTEF